MGGTLVFLIFLSFYRVTPLPKRQVLVLAIAAVSEPVTVNFIYPFINEVCLLYRPLLPLIHLYCVDACRYVKLSKSTCPSLWTVVRLVLFIAVLFW